MRIVLHNPHTLWFKSTVAGFIANTKSVNKYDYIFDYLYNNDDSVFVYVDSSSSSPLFRGILRILNTPTLEFYGWVFINRLNPFRFKIISDVDKLSKEDILMTFLYEHFTNLRGVFSIPRTPMIEIFQRITAFKVVHLSHYGYNSGLGSRNTQEAGIDLFVSENDLAKNGGFFKNYYHWYKKSVYPLPYVPHDRFVKKANFKERINKALATGTITHPMEDNDFVSYFNHGRLQPLRHEIYSNVKELEEYIDSLITDIRDYGDGVKREDINRKNSFQHQLDSLKVIRAIKYSLFDLHTILRVTIFLLSGKAGYTIKNERSYYKLDIIEKYNEYKMFIVPEEIIDLPAIGFVEGMACGSAFIGARAPMYEDLGLIDKVHYIGYDGSLNDLKDKIAYYQEHHDELEKIADNGYRYVRANFNKDRVMKDFMAYLTNEVKHREREKT